VIAHLGVMQTMRMMNERVVSTLADPTRIVDTTAPVYAAAMEESWDDMTEERKRLWRALAYNVYEAHVKNKLGGLDAAVETIEAVQTAPSTPKSWLRGVQEAKNFLMFRIAELKDDIETRVEVPDTVPDALDMPDPYKDLRAGDAVPEELLNGTACGALHEDNWVCTRPPHPDHWNHWDSDMGEYGDDDELRPELEGRILATWRQDQRLDTLHPALGDLDDE